MAETGSSSINGHDDVYAYEELQERRALIQTMHGPMKQWFYSEKNFLLKEHFGQFPLFWQEIENWEPWKEVNRLYLMAIDKQDRGVEYSIEELIKEAKEKKKLIEPIEVNELAYDQEKDDNLNFDQNEGETERRKKRKERWGTVKKSRWGNAEEQNQLSEEANELESETAKPKKSRWSTGPENPLVSPFSLLTPEQCQELAILQLKVKQVNEKLLTVVEDAKKREQDPNKTPSPPPKYDARGIRINTREVRTRDTLNNERQLLLSAIMKLNPMFQGTEFKKEKISRRVYIPIAEHPDCNFIGLIIGPRGNTQKRMEKETQCKIMIRGKGSVKEGSKNRIVNLNDDDDDLHVMISGDCEEDVIKAEEMVRKLLTPGDHNEEHKQKQLKELALINGTLREDNYCHICGDQGHRQWECPKRQLNFKTVEVRCNICGDTSHPTSDCRLRNQDPHREAELDQEYLNFMAELNGEEPPKLKTQAPSGPMGTTQYPGQCHPHSLSSNEVEYIPNTQNGLNLEMNNGVSPIDHPNSDGVSQSSSIPSESNPSTTPNEFPHYYAKSRYAPWQLQKVDQTANPPPMHSYPPPANYFYNYQQYLPQTYPYQQTIVPPPAQPTYDEWQTPIVPQVQHPPHYYGYQQYPQDYHHHQPQQPYSPCNPIPHNSYPNTQYPHYQYSPMTIPPQQCQQQGGSIQMDYDPFQGHQINSSDNTNNLNVPPPSLSSNLETSHEQFQ